MSESINITIPNELENMKLPSPELVTFYKNLENRILWLDCEVDNNYLEFARMILQWNFEDKEIKQKKDRKPIKLLIFSSGGSLDINDSLVDIIKLSKTPVYGYNMGIACSAACFIFMSCHKRFAMPKSTFLIHKGSAENISGSFDQIISYIQEYERKIDELAKFVLEHSKIPIETLEQNLGTEWYITAKEAIDYGFCDSIVNNLDEIYE